MGLLSQLEQVYNLSLQPIGVLAASLTFFCFFFAVTTSTQTAGTPPWS